MDTNNINGSKPKINNAEHSSHTEPPRWQGTSASGYDGSQGSSRKFYTLLAGWLVVLGVAVAASLGAGRAERGRGAQNAPLGENAFARAASSADPYAENAAEGDQRPDVSLLAQPGNSMPAAFAHTQENVIAQPQLLQSAAFILANGERPLRVLHIGDSHVAGRTFPLAVKETLTRCLGKAQSADEGRGVWFNYTGRNGATSAHLNTDAYMADFAEKRPDLIIISLGTNEAHGMGYREDQHERQLDAFFARLRQACPDAALLITTPPGDYLTSSYVDYRQTARSKNRSRRVKTGKRANPMSARCAWFLIDYAHGNHMAVWDLFGICGGEEAAHANWTGSNLMRPDKIHFQPAGYEIQGHLLGEALVKALAGEAGGE